jgi:hypothetical protein
LAGQHIKASLVGMRHYSSNAQDAARAVKGAASLVREPRNPHDPNAVAVISRDKKLGHLDKKSAARVARIMDASGTCTIRLDATKSVTASTVPVIIDVEPAAGSRAKDAQSAVPIVCKGVVAGIYEIRVLSEKRSYFGQSLDAQARVQTHWRDLASGCHANPELQRHWDDYGPSGFRIRLISRAPSDLTGLDLARWLAFEERAAITKAGGLRKTINAEWPKPVLGPAEKRQLASERLRAECELAALEAHVSGLQKRLIEPRASLAAVQQSVEASQRWWGLRASREDKAVAKIAHKAIPNLIAEIAELEAELEVAKNQLRAKREHLFL